MEFQLPRESAEKYKSGSQRTRVMTETWALDQLYCPNCGYKLTDFEKNKPVADFYCTKCREEYELKSAGKNFGSKVVDGAYKTMIERIQSAKRPNLILLSYNPVTYSVTDITAIPKQFFISSIIEPRKPLPPHARRAGWRGCNIVLKDLPTSSVIRIVRDKSVVPKQEVLSRWKKVKFVEDIPSETLKGWTLDVMKCVETIGKNSFSLEEVYQCEGTLRNKYPKNRHIKDKIRQQLQYLRDRGFISFQGKGIYKMK